MDEAYGSVLRSGQPIAVQFSRQDTHAAAQMALMATAWAESD